MTCKACLNSTSGKCNLHNLTPEQRSERSRKAALTRSARNPEKYSAHCRKAGRKGFIATLNEHGQSTALELARQWRLENPSNPEVAFMELLDRLLLVYDREVEIPATFMTIDFVITGNGVAFHEPIAVEVDGHPYNDEGRYQRLSNKIKLCAERGLKVIVMDFNDFEEWETILINHLKTVGYMPNGFEN